MFILDTDIFEQDAPESEGTPKNAELQSWLISTEIVLLAVNH